MLARISCVAGLLVGVAYGCDCTEASVQAKFDDSEVVFRGTITALRDSGRDFDILGGFVRDTRKTAVFRVTRVWKGQVASTFEMPAVEETSACIGFGPSYLKVGSDLLVYGKRRGEYYFTWICGFHKPALGAKDFDQLGAGREPPTEKEGRSK